MKEASRFYSSLGLLIFLNAVVKPVWIFGIDRQVQNEVGAASYGAYFALFNFTFVLGFLLDWGLTYFYNRQLAAKDPSAKDKVGSFIFVKLIFAGAYAIIIFLVAWAVGITNWELISYVALIQILTSMFVFVRAIITSQQWFRTDALLSVLDKTLMILLCGVLLYLPSWLGRITIERFLLLQIACTGVALILALSILLVRKFHLSFTPLWPGKDVFRAALPFAIIVLLMTFHSRIDGFLIERIIGPEEAGKYAAAYRLLDAANMFGILFSSFLLPYITRHLHEERNIERVVLNVRHCLCVFAIVIIAIFFFLGPWIQQVLYHHDDDKAVSVLRWCIPSLIGYALVHVYGTVMTASGHITSFAYITAIAVVLNLVLNFVLIPLEGALGSCIAALVSQLFAGVATTVFVTRKLKINLDLRSIVMYVLIGAAVAGFLYLSLGTQLNRWLVIIGTGILVIILMWLTRLIEWRNWRILTRG
ncbi:MAG: polysaccharide biosynthesis C-terminal domain-containing protein [Chitinophagaceae bacterium]|nr:polysaccharide biosynthesis C-terminal domain-containing protein [Chitinophagaceae bacterium]